MEQYASYSPAIAFGFLLMITCGGGRDSIFDFDINRVYEFAREEESFFTFGSEFMLRATVSAVQFFTGLFVIASLLPSFTSMIDSKSKLGFFGAVAAQVGWIICMANELASVGSIFAVASAAAYIFVLYNQKKASVDESPEAYWLIKFPLGLAAGWSFVVFIMTLSMILGGEADDGDRRMEEDEDGDGFSFNFSIGSGFFTLIAFILMVAAAGAALMYSPIAPDYGFAGVIGWSLIGFALNGGEGGDDGGDDEDGGFSFPVAALSKVITLLTGLGIVCGTIFLAHKEEKDVKLLDAEPKAEYTAA